jgi:hypothetical protein
LIGIESVIALAWTLVVFAAISVQLADIAHEGTMQSDPSKQKEEQDSE